jgi:hypothetical protein
MEPTIDAPVTPPRTGLLAAFDELLTRPLAYLDRAREGGRGLPAALLAASVLGYALYGAAGGFFQGGTQILVAALKAPLIILLTLVLCLPSLYVFSATAGARWTRKNFLALVTGFASLLSLVLLALLPVSWLFSASSRHLGSAAFLQFVLWVVALGLSWRILGQMLGACGARPGALVLWIALFCLVSLQVATMMRPVLERKPGMPLFVSGKKSVLEQMQYVFGD